MVIKSCYLKFKKKQQPYLKDINIFTLCLFPLNMELANSQITLSCFSSEEWMVIPAELIFKEPNPFGVLLSLSVLLMFAQTGTWGSVGFSDDSPQVTLSASGKSRGERWFYMYMLPWSWFNEGERWNSLSPQCHLQRPNIRLTAMIPYRLMSKLRIRQSTLCSSLFLTDPILCPFLPPTSALYYSRIPLHPWESSVAPLE